ncbi:hypothetical protein AHAS_Ahas01G0184400 [Arachis hypogaea]
MNGYHSLGFFKNFQSHAVITIALQQLKGLLDIKDFTTKSDIFSVMHLVWSNVHHGINIFVLLYIYKCFNIFR